jgi:hypothetical protein
VHVSIEIQIFSSLSKKKQYKKYEAIFFIGCLFSPQKLFLVRKSTSILRLVREIIKRRKKRTVEKLINGLEFSFANQ